MAVGSLMNYGYVPSRYLQQRQESTRHFVDKLGQGVTKIASGVSSEVSKAVESKKQDAQLRAQAAELGTLADSVSKIIAGDPGPIGQKAASGMASGQFSVKPVPSTKATADELKQYITSTNTGLSTLVTNLAGSNQLSSDTLNKLSSAFSNAGVAIDLTKPLAEQTKTERSSFVESRISPAVLGGRVTGEAQPTGPEQPVHPRYQPGGGGFTEQDIARPSATLPKAETQEAAAQNLATYERIRPSAKPPISSTEAKESLTFSTLPTDSDKQKSAMEEIYRARNALRAQQLSNQIRGQNIQIEKATNDLVIAAINLGIKQGDQRLRQLPPLYGPQGFPTSNVWSEEDKAIADEALKLYGEGALLLQNREGEMKLNIETEPVNVRRSGGGGFTTRPQVPGAAPAPAPAAASESESFRRKYNY